MFVRMKTLNAIEQKGLVFLKLMALSILAWQANTGAELALPYSADENTLHLWHFNNTNLVNNYFIVPDEGNGNALTLTNMGLPNGAPPFTNIFIVPSIQLSNLLQNCLMILPGGGSPATRAFAMAASTPQIDPSIMINPETGAFTFEAIVYPTGDLFSSGLNWQIFCGDNSSGQRGWQWRIQTGNPPKMNFNFITAANGNGGNFTVDLPVSGPNAITTNQWYHAAVTYTGNNPTNGDTAGILTFYWTLLDPNKSEASPLATNYVAEPAGTIGGTPSPAIGGSQRTINGVGNGEGFVGFIDEVRVSSISRSASDMAFKQSTTINPPVVIQNPATNIFIAFGKQLQITVIISGSEPLSYQWQFSKNGQTFSNITGQNKNSFLVSSVNFSNDGYYKLIASNPAGSVTSSIVKVDVGAAFSELYHTGVDANGLCDTNLTGLVDLHYKLYISSDIDFLGPDAIIWDMHAAPIAMVGGGGNFSNPDGISQWIGPRQNPYTSPEGKYVYRTTFVADTIDLSRPVKIEGTWWSQVTGVDILLNGKSTGNASGITNNPAIPVKFVITNGFVAGVNTLDFVTDCTFPTASARISAIRVQIDSIGYALPEGAPIIVSQPMDQTVRDSAYGWGSIAKFEVAAQGRAPLAYQWYCNDEPMPLQTNRVLVLDNPSVNAINGNSFYVVVSNDSGSVTSRIARLTLLDSNTPPKAINKTFITQPNQIVTINLGELFASCSDSDGDHLTITGFDQVTTNNVTLSQAGAVLSFTPPEGFVGVDQFSYTISDGYDVATGYITIQVAPSTAPKNVTAKISNKNIIITGEKGTPNSPFRVLSSTDLSLPLAQWITEKSGLLDSNGNFVFTNEITTGTNHKFYVITVP